ncbi:uncharacterized protein LOC142162979 [Nicotiana tabacum]|uniref:Uncharacterized protein LOC142162979 n=1 Tax=Nicotiana tabacum TaxID=4097 RepID=A0AC58RUC1_TOBAC
MDCLKSFEDREKFSIKKASQHFIPTSPKVSWKSLALVKGIIPRHQFILWLTVHKKLSTVDRLQKWGIKMMQDCVLCNTNAVETLEHLFFCCDYSKHIWSSLLHWLGEKRPVRGWNDEVMWASKRTNNSRVRAGIIGFLFAASIYHIWAERTRRRFRNQRR